MRVALIIFLVLFIPCGLWVIFFGYTRIPTENDIDFVKKIDNLGPIATWLSSSITFLFTPVSVYLVYLTFKRQNEQLNETKKQLEKQSKNQDQDRFEKTFFNMLNYFDDISKSVKSTVLTSDGKKEYVGKEFFNKMHFDVFHELCEREKKSGNKNLTLLLMLERDMGTYIGVLNCLLYLIDQSSITEKGIYIELIKSMITGEQKYTVRYYVDESLMEETKALKELINKYDICDQNKKEEFAKKFNEKMQEVKK
nr:hypothetical protein [uncultured Anaeromusa sp.]